MMLVMSMIPEASSVVLNGAVAGVVTPFTRSPKRAGSCLAIIVSVPVFVVPENVAGSNSQILPLWAESETSSSRSTRPVVALTAMLSKALTLWAPTVRPSMSKSMVPPRSGLVMSVKVRRHSRVRPMAAPRPSLT